MCFLRAGRFPTNGLHKSFKKGGVDKKMIYLGEKVKDKITGFRGVAIAQCVYLNGCVCYEVQPPCGKDGKMPQAIWIDEQQLEAVGRKPAEKKAIRRRRPGGPQDRPPSRSTPTTSSRGQGYHDNRYTGRKEA